MYQGTSVPATKTESNYYKWQYNMQGTTEAWWDEAHIENTRYVSWSETAEETLVTERKMVGMGTPTGTGWVNVSNPDPTKELYDGTMPWLGGHIWENTYGVSDLSYLQTKNPITVPMKGSYLFFAHDYDIDANTTFSVQYADNTNYDNWQTIETYTNSTSGGWTNESVHYYFEPYSTIKLSAIVV